MSAVLIKDVTIRFVSKIKMVIKCSKKIKLFLNIIHQVIYLRGITNIVINPLSPYLKKP